MKKIIAFSGSNSIKSINQELIDVCASMIDGVEVEVLSLRDYEAPIFSTDLNEASGLPESMERFYEKMATADGYLVSLPEYNGSMTSVLKNTFDWISIKGQKFFNEKPTVFLSTSPGPRGAAAVLSHVVDIMPYRGADIVGSYALGSFYDKVQDGKIQDADANGIVSGLLEDLKSKL